MFEMAEVPNQPKESLSEEKNRRVRASKYILYKVLDRPVRVAGAPPFLVPSLRLIKMILK